MLKEQQVEALRVLEALEASLLTDSNLLNEQELADLREAMTELANTREQATLPDQIKSAIEHVDAASSEFASRRMDVSIKQALQGQSVDEV
jgi:molecular chaperone HscA